MRELITAGFVNAASNVELTGWGSLVFIGSHDHLGYNSPRTRL